jgi:hypothetical protein
MDNLKQIVQRVVAGYAKDGLNCISYLTQSEDGNLLTVVDIEDGPQTHDMDISVVVRIIGEQVVIERDLNNKLVVDALVQAGVERKHIILAYAGESVPEAI